MARAARVRWTEPIKAFTCETMRALSATASLARRGAPRLEARLVSAR